MKQGENKAEVRLNGQLYRLRFDLYALEQIEDEYGGIREAFAALRGGKGMIKTIRTMFRILANSQRNMDGLPEDVTGDEINKHGSIEDMNKISEAIKAAITIGMGTEVAGGEADNKRENPLDKEYNEKNG